MFCHCHRTSTFFYLDCDRTSTFALKQNEDILSQVTGDHLEAFRLVSLGGGQNVTMVKITMRKTAKSRCSFQTSSWIGKIIEKTPKKLKGQCHEIVICQNQRQLGQGIDRRNQNPKWTKCHSHWCVKITVGRNVAV
jgi:hypothetical protein